MNFASDNVVGASPEILEAIVKANAEPFKSYGDDPVTARVEQRLKEVFECDLRAYPVTTGSAANALALASIMPRYGVVYCHREAHIEMDECGAPEFYTGGGKLTVLDGPDAKIAPNALQAAIHGAGFVHSSQPAAVSITNLTECGAAYRPDEVSAISAVAKQHGLKLHMDGARFANALVTAGCTPAEITWKAGVDVLSFGATKNGALAAEAVVFFGENTTHGPEFEFLRKRGGHLLSKMRLLSAQLDGYLADDLWLRNARNANAAASVLAKAIEAAPNLHLLNPVEGNELFIALPVAKVEQMRAAGFLFYDWPADVSAWHSKGTPYQAIRLITAFNSDAGTVRQLASALTD